MSLADFALSEFRRPSLRRPGTWLSWLQSGSSNSRLTATTVDPLQSNEAFDRDNDPRMRDRRWNGWGYRHTSFSYDPYEDTFYLESKGHRTRLPKLRVFLKEFQIDPLLDRTPAQPTISIPDPHPDDNDVVGQIRKACPNATITQEHACRLWHSHGHTAQEIYALRNGMITRVVDAVVYPSSYDDVSRTLRLATQCGAVIIPFGGGTSVTMALLPRADEERFIISVDLMNLNKLEWIREADRLACLQAGMTGQEIEESLRSLGYTLGHEPDSYEFSTLGGWIATKASGMKKNRYGNIEDIVIDFTYALADGTIRDYSRLVERVSSGPDIKSLLIGSEGTLALILRAVVKIQELPPVRRFESWIFPTWEDGVCFMKACAWERIAPSSFRLMDCEQLRFGSAMQIHKNAFASAMASFKIWLVKNVKKYDLRQASLATSVMEGSAAEVKNHQLALNSTAKRFGGIYAGTSGGEAGYKLTFMIAYIRDFIMDVNWVGESFETSVPWTQALDVYKAVHQSIEEEAKKYETARPPFVTGRLSQVYPEGCCLYFYFGFSCAGLERPLEVYTAIEAAARRAIMQAGGTISHHHGVGKLRSCFLYDQIPRRDVEVIRATKRELDPKNTFGAANLFPENKKRLEERSRESIATTTVTSV